MPATDDVYQGIQLETKTVWKCTAFIGRLDMTKVHRTQSSSFPAGVSKSLLWRLTVIQTNMIPDEAKTYFGDCKLGDCKLVWDTSVSGGALVTRGIDGMSAWLAADPRQTGCHRPGGIAMQQHIQGSHCTSPAIQCSAVETTQPLRTHL